MIAEDYVSYEVAKLLKEKGFDGEITTLVEEDNTKYDLTLSGFIQADVIPCPTHQMAMKWLREKDWHIVILFDYRYVDEKLAYIPVITPMKAGDAICLKQGGFPTYEEAVEAALKYCLTELI